MIPHGLAGSFDIWYFKETRRRVHYPCPREYRMASKALGVFKVSNELLDHCEQLKLRFEEDGYLFFRGVLDLDKIQQVKSDFVDVLQQQGIAKARESEAIWTGVGIEAIDDRALYGQTSYVELIESQRTRDLMERVLGEAVYKFKATNIRYSLPHDPRHVTPPHQDHFFIRANSEFRTVWIPLMPIDKRVGGLVVAAGSHRGGLREHVEQESVFSYQMKGRKQRGVALDTIAEPWLTTEYLPGDVVVFHCLTLHWAL